MLFESLNDRGVPLSAIDLIKNKMLGALEGKEGSVEKAFDRWNLIIANLPDYHVQERFLRQYYNAFKQSESIRVAGFARATRSNLIHIYETLIGRDPNHIFDELIEKSAVYQQLTDPESVEEGRFMELKAELRDLVNVQAAPSYISLLYLFGRFGYLSNDFYRKVIAVLVKYFIRRNITDFPNTRNVDQMFMDLVQQLEEGKIGPLVEDITVFLSDKNRMASLPAFEERLRGDIYELNVDATRFILSKIEEHHSTRENRQDFWERDHRNNLIWTIEHIFPEGQNIPDGWVEMIAGGDRQQAEEIRAEWVHKLGNLTLTGYNQHLSNLEFKKKRDRIDPRGNPIGSRVRS